MYYVSEEMVKTLVTQSAVTDCVARAFASLAKGDAQCFPIVREKLNHKEAIFGFKSGFDRQSPVLGVKAGGLWPGNAARGLANHQSTVVMFDPDSGAPSALVRATYLTALRTAAASALSIRHLARRNARVLGIMGAGGQGEYQLAAALGERDFEQVLVCGRNTTHADTLAGKAAARGLAAAVVEAEDLAARADVIITVTPSRQPLLRDHWIKPGTHLACMGADTIGKQEVEATLLKRAELFGDIPEQAVTLGECQHAFAQRLIAENSITTLGAVIAGDHPGRSSETAITLFDSTGIALQDLLPAQLAVSLARQANQIIELD